MSFLAMNDRYNGKDDIDGMDLFDSDEEYDTLELDDETPELDFEHD